ncbi:cyclin-A1-4 isoform X2 [Aristolochia californica]|uniref:cyclin-A1-4 isoform X2 n=1 Tax=Aristolochia californica TaxID=171875 RepID=UPI0035D9BEF9
MASQTRRASISSSSSSVKRPSSENAGKAAVNPVQQPKKRPALANLTNHTNVGRNVIRTAGKQVQVTSSLSKVKQNASLHSSYSSLQQNNLHPSISVKQITAVSSKNSSIVRNDEPKPAVVPILQSCSAALSPSRSDCASVSMDETMSTCDSLKSPDVEYIDNGDSSIVASLERRTCNTLHISEAIDVNEEIWKKDIVKQAEGKNIVVDIDDNHQNPQQCASFAGDIYKHLREAETKKRPSTDFMEQVQKDINASMRSILIDWLVEVAEEYRLVPDTLYLTINYIDRYLSGNAMNRQRLQLLGVACMLIAAKYEEICAPQVEEFCYITDNTYFRDEVLQMEAEVLRYLKFEMTTPTAKCFLRRFLRAAQGCNEVPTLQLEFLTSYLAELSLLEYEMLCYKPSLIAASAIFLANFILLPSMRPWNATLRHYTLYKSSELRECVKALHRLFCNSHGSNLPAIREKYSQHKYKFVAKKYCPSTIPLELFQDT